MYRITTIKSCTRINSCEFIIKVKGENNYGYGVRNDCDARDRYNGFY